MTNSYPTIGRIGRCLVESALMLLVAASVSAEPIKYTLVNATFNDGGIATGYLVFDSPSDPLLSPTVTDWAIRVSGGNPNIPQFVYDPTVSTVEVLSGDTNAIVFHGPSWSALSCGGEPRRIRFGVSFDAAGETCAVERGFVTGSFQQVPGPVITVKANNQHPWNRVIITGAFVRFSLDLSPAGSTADLDWYYAIDWDGSVFWVTPAGISLTPAPLGHGPAVSLSNQTLFVWPLGGTTISAWFFAANGSSVVAIDHMTASVLSSP